MLKVVDVEGLRSGCWGRGWVRGVGFGGWSRGLGSGSWGRRVGVGGLGSGEVGSRGVGSGGVGPGGCFHGELCYYLCVMNFFFFLKFFC